MRCAELAFHLIAIPLSKVSFKIIQSDAFYEIVNGFRGIAVFVEHDMR